MKHKTNNSKFFHIFKNNQMQKRRDNQSRIFTYMKIFIYKSKNIMVYDITAALYPHAPYKGKYLVNWQNYFLE